MVTKCWIILLVDRADLRRPQAAVSRWGRRTRQLRRAMLFGSERNARRYLHTGGDPRPRRKGTLFKEPPCPWNSRWLPVVIPLELNTGESITALLDVHMELR